MNIMDRRLKEISLPWFLLSGAVVGGAAIPIAIVFAMAIDGLVALIMWLIGMEGGQARLLIGCVVIGTGFGVAVGLIAWAGTREPEGKSFTDVFVETYKAGITRSEQD